MGKVHRKSVVGAVGMSGYPDRHKIGKGTQTRTPDSRNVAHKAFGTFPFGMMVGPV